MSAPVDDPATIASSSSAVPRRAPRRGTTLLELMLVLTIVGLVFGIGFGLLTSLDLGQRAAVGIVQNVLRAARNTAIASDAPALVRFDLEQGQLTAEALQVVGTWHFEEPTLRGAFDLTGSLEGAKIVPAGFIGGALSFEDSPRGSTASIGVTHLPSYDIANGFAIELAVYLSDEPAGRVVDLGGAAGIDVVDAGALEAWFVQRVVRGDDQDAAGGAIVVRSAPGLARPGRWIRLRASYDRRVFRMSADGVPVAELEVDAPVWNVEGPLQLSDGRRFFAGKIDNLVIRAVGAEEVVQLPGEVRFAAGTPREIRFAPGGSLDREVHQEPVVIQLEYADGRRRELRVGLYGTVE